MTDSGELKAGDRVAHWSEPGRTGIIIETEPDEYAGNHDPVYHVEWAPGEPLIPMRRHQQLVRLPGYRVTEADQDNNGHRVYEVTPDKPSDREPVLWVIMRPDGPAALFTDGVPCPEPPGDAMYAALARHRADLAAQAKRGARP